MNRIPEINGGIKVLGVPFQAFEPEPNVAVFSTSGVARGLKMPRQTVADILSSDQFKALRGNDSSLTKLLTTANSQPISVVTQTDLVFLVQIAAEKDYPVAKSMNAASFAVLLQQSVDETLGINRPRHEYLDAGATLRQRLEYRYSYHAMKGATFDRGHGVRGLCRVNRQVSALAVVDADQRRALSKDWRRKYCSGLETIRLTIGNTLHHKAIEASNRLSLDNNLMRAAQRTEAIYKLLDEPF